MGGFIVDAGPTLPVRRAETIEMSEGTQTCAIFAAMTRYGLSSDRTDEALNLSWSIAGPTARKSS